jgi:hypothetical protein
MTNHSPAGYGHAAAVQGDRQQGRTDSRADSPHKRVRTRGLRRTGSIRGGRQLWKHPAWPSADHRDGDDRVTASACPCPSQPSQNITGVTARGETLRLSRLIRVLWLIRGTGTHRIHHEARIHRENVAKAADVRVAVPRLERVAPWRRETGPRQLCQAPDRRSRGGSVTCVASAAAGVSSSAAESARKTAQPGSCDTTSSTTRWCHTITRNVPEGARLERDRRDDPSPTCENPPHAARLGMWPYGGQTAAVSPNPAGP